MEFITCGRLEDMWDKFDMSQKGTIIEQLRDFFSQLRKIKAPFIRSVDRTACEDQLFTDGLGVYGPYANESEFNQGIVTALKRSQQGPWVDIVREMIVNPLKDHDIVLTHSNFAPKNILVQGVKVLRS
jgi:hypothetical protein